MIKVDLSNAIKNETIKKYALKVKKIATKMEEFKTVGFEYLGWLNLTKNYDKIEFKEIQKSAKFLHEEKIEVLVVVGIGGSFAGAKAAIDMIQGEIPEKRKMEVIFMGESLSSTNLAQKLKYIQKKKFAINVISKSGTTLEPSVTFRLVRTLLEKNVGVQKSQKLIFATTDANKGLLLNASLKNNYKTFVVPDNVGGRFSVLTAVGLFPMACAGIEISFVMNGAKKATNRYATIELMENDAYKYAVARTALMKKYNVEMMVQYEPQMKSFNEWWKQLAGESEGKNEKGLLPTSVVFSTDLHSLGQFIQEGSKILFETVLTVRDPKFDVIIEPSKEDLDKLNYLTSKTVDEINKVAFYATTDAHVKVGKVPNIHIEYENFSEEAFGELVIFFERAITMTAYLMDINPFNQPGVEVYKQNIFKSLGKK